jgi:hypothetical protein
MFLISVFAINLLSQGLKTVEVIQIYIIILRYDKKCDGNLEKT